MHANIKRAKKEKPPDIKKAPPSDPVEAANVVSLRARRERKRNHGR
jgi:hypothetical protein